MGQNRKQRRIIAKKNKASTASISKKYIQEKANLLSLLDKQAKIYCQQERFADAEPIYRQCLKISNKIFELDHPVLCVVALTNLAGVLRELEKYAEVESLCRIGFDKLEKILADNSFNNTRKLNDLAISLCDNLINVLYHFARHAEAETLCHRVLEFQEQGISLKNIEVVKILNNMANPLFENCRYATAEALYRRSFEILKKEYGSDHPDAAMILHNWALVLFNLDRYAEAEPLFCQALELMENAKNTEQSRLAVCLNNIGNLMGKLGRYIEAERHHRRALHIRKSILEPEHNDVAVSLSNLALQLYNLERYAEAEPLYRQALEIQEKLKNSDLSGTLNNLALLLCKLGRHAEAEPLQRHAFEIDRNVYGPDHPYVTGSLNNLTKYLSPFEAEPLLSSVLEMREKKLGPNHPDVAASLNNLALIYCHLDKYEEAELNHQRALEIEENFYGKDHTEVGVTLHNIAKHLYSIHRSAEAEQLYYRSLAILKKNCGTKHHLVALSLKSLAVLFETTDRLPSAILLAKRAINILQGSRQDVSALGEKTLDSFDKTIEHYYGFTTKILINAKRYGEAEFVMAMLKEKEQFELWRGNEYENLSIREISYNDVETPLVGRLEELGSFLNALGKQEETLSHKTDNTTGQNLELEAIRIQLNKANKEFIDFLGNLHEALPTTENKDVDQSVVDLSGASPGTALIFTVTAEDSFHSIMKIPHRHPIPFSSKHKADDIAKKIIDFRCALKDYESWDFLSLAEELYEIILRPIEKDLEEGNYTTLLWMLNGAIRLLPIGALYDVKQKQYVLQKKFSNVCITTVSKIAASKRRHWNGLGVGVTRALGNHPALTNVKQELEGIIKQNDINGVIEGHILLDDDFTREAMLAKLNQGYKAVHIASHFDLDPANETLCSLLLGDGTSFRMDEIRSHNNLFNGVDIVAFSACETGNGTSGTRGREVDGIGYLGELLGAQSVLASLWKIEDCSTSMLMQKFYSLREDGMTKAKALQNAQCALLNGEFGQDFIHPYFWAPFILIGNGG